MVARLAEPGPPAEVPLDVVGVGPGEVPVDGDALGPGLLHHLQVEQANLSQHLAVLRARQIVVSRKAGNQVYYSLRDPVLIQVLDLLKQYFNAHLSETAALLDEMAADSKRPA